MAPRFLPELAGRFVIWLWVDEGGRMLACFSQQSPGATSHYSHSQSCPSRLPIQSSRKGERGNEESQVRLSLHDFCLFGDRDGCWLMQVSRRTQDSPSVSERLQGMKRKQFSIRQWEKYFCCAIGHFIRRIWGLRLRNDNTLKYHHCDHH